MSISMIISYDVAIDHYLTDEHLLIMSFVPYPGLILELRSNSKDGPEFIKLVVKDVTWNYYSETFHCEVDEL